MAKHLFRLNLNQIFNQQRFVVNRQITAAGNLLANGQQQQERALSFAINNCVYETKSNSNLVKFNRYQNDMQQKRYKKKSSGEEDDDDEGYSAELDSIPAGQSVSTTINVKSLKLEFVLTKSLFKTRAQFEEAISKGRLRLNGEEVKSKNYDVEELDTIDYIIGRNRDNYDHLDVNRIIITTLPDKMIKGRVDIEIEKWMNLTIENYIEAWDGKSSA